MPNWNKNYVTVHADIEKVKEFFHYDAEQFQCRFFNMYMLFGEDFKSGDIRGFNAKDGERWDENTGSRGIPRDIEFQGSNPTFLTYRTRWLPNNGTLKRLSELTNWKVENQYSESHYLRFEGNFLCEAGKVTSRDEQHIIS